MKEAKPEFDPFNSRLARDIRNSLSNSFLIALADKDQESYRKKACEYLGKSLEKTYRFYVKERLKKYDAVFGAITRKSSEDTIQQAELLWMHGLYFEMHELLEKLWIDAEGARRKALQGLIRAAGMKIHAANGNMKAAASMGRKARADLELYGNSLAQSAGIEAISMEIDRTLSKMDVL